jgi:2-dehydro-3-deoxy-D-arabinonate dehydratase
MMQIMKFAMHGDRTSSVGLVQGDQLVPVGHGEGALSEILHAADPESTLRGMLAMATSRVAISSVRVLAPIDDQEVWGAGVTYERSKVARQQESDRAATFYDLVYRADRPELFFKATRSRIVDPGQAIRVRRDSVWSVPEPELALVLGPTLELKGITIGNDVSARDIEGENPLYLPQAKVYKGCCALGPSITLVSTMPQAASIGIRMDIERDGVIVYAGETSAARMARRFDQLIDWLGRDNVFPTGVFLFTGTGLVPPDDFSLRQGDLVRIAIDGIGVLSNPVVHGTAV